MHFGPDEFDVVDGPRMMTIRVTQHVPNYIEMAYPHVEQVDTLEAALALPWVKVWEQPFKGQRFIGWRRSDNKLMSLYGAADHWWVVAFVTPSSALMRVRWAVHKYGIDPAKIVLLSRGGTASWYGIEGARYVDVFDHCSIDEFRSHTAASMKQRTLRLFDRTLIRRVVGSIGGAGLLHPGIMYALFMP